MSIVEALARLQESQRAWRDCPDRPRFTALQNDLYKLIRAVVEEKGRNSPVFQFTAPRLAGSLLRHCTVRWEGRDSGVVTAGKRSFDLRDVVHETLRGLTDKYLVCPVFEITSEAYICGAMALRAHAMARSADRQLGTVEIENPGELPQDETDRLAEAGEPGFVVAAATPRAELGDNPLAQEGPEVGLEELPVAEWERQQAVMWFHYPGRPGSPAVWRDVPALSLRHCYVALRHQSGATLVEIARELGLRHSSSLTALKEEIRDFFPPGNEGGFVPLGDFAPVGLAPAVVALLGVGPRQPWDRLRQPCDTAQRDWLQARKGVLWSVLRIARALFLEDVPASRPHWWSWRDENGAMAGEVLVEVATFSGPGRWVRLHDVRGL